MAGAINALLNLGSTGNAQAVAQGQGGKTDDQDADSNPFAQLLSDSAYTQDQGNRQCLKGQVPQQSAGTAVCAQDIAADELETALGQILPSPDQSVSPQDMEDMLKKVQLLLDRSTDVHKTKLLTEVKEQLQALHDGGKSLSVTEVLDGVPALKEVLMRQPALAALEEHHSEDSQGMEKESPAQLAALLQSLPAGMFRSHRREDSSTTSAKGKEAEKSEGDVTVAAVQMQAVVVQPVAYQAEAVSTALQGEQMEAANAIDARIPSLELKGDDLPKVDLPRAGAARLDDVQEKDTGVASDMGAPGLLSDAKMEGGEHFASSTTHSATVLEGINSHAGVGALGKAAQVLNMVPTHGYINHAPTTEQVRVAIHQVDKDGLDKITIQLEPLELGRVEVHMLRGADGHAQISFTIDKPETFDSLSRDARVLERSLQEAGIKADTGSMQFNLRQQPQPQMESGMQGDGKPQQQAQLEDEDANASSVAPLQAIAAHTRQYLINIREGVDISA